jgi:hypothetical protein
MDAQSAVLWRSIPATKNSCQRWGSKSPWHKSIALSPVPMNTAMRKPWTASYSREAAAEKKAVLSPLLMDKTWQRAILHNLHNKHHIWTVANWLPNTNAINVCYKASNKHIQ